VVRWSRKICSPLTINSERRKSLLAINTHLYAYFLSTSFSFEFKDSVDDTVSIRVDGSTHHLADRIGHQKRRRHRWRPKECEKGSLAIPTKSPFVFVLFRRIKWLKPPY
jgi:hypothetical protein